MRWFKFYGQDWLTDMKIRQMSPEDKLCYITLLSLASSADEDGLIRNCSEEEIINLTGLYYDPYDDNNPYTRASGCLKRYEALHCVTLCDNGSVIVNNFNKRQTENLSNAERQKRYRERLKISKKKSNDSYVTQRNDSNARIEENRIDNISELSSQNSLKDNNKDMGWNKKSDNDDDLPVIGDDGEIEKTEEARLKEQNEKVTALIEWAEKVRKKKFIDTTTQRKMIHDMRKAKISPDVIKKTYLDLLHSEYWQKQDRLPDFKTVFSNLKNKK